MSECLDACYNLFHTFDILLIALIMARLYSSGTLSHENVIVTQRQLIITYENCFCILELVTGCNSHIFKISGWAQVWQEWVWHLCAHIWVTSLTTAVFVVTWTLYWSCTLYHLYWCLLVPWSKVAFWLEHPQYWARVKRGLYLWLVVCLLFISKKVTKFHAISSFPLILMYIIEKFTLGQVNISNSALVVMRLQQKAKGMKSAFS